MPQYPGIGPDAGSQHTLYRSQKLPILRSPLIHILPRIGRYCDIRQLIGAAQYQFSTMPSSPSPSRSVVNLEKQTQGNIE